MNKEEIEKIFDKLELDIELFKNIYPYSNDNQCYTRAFNMCIKLVQYTKEELISQAKQ